MTGPYLDEQGCTIEECRSGNVLVGVDGTATSWRALHYAFGVARSARSKVVAMYSETSSAPEAPVPSDFQLELIRVNDDLVDELRQTVRSLASENGVEAVFIRMKGEPVSSILRLSRECMSNQIVVGASARLTHRLFGSVSQRVLKTSSLPVTVVP